MARKPEIKSRRQLKILGQERLSRSRLACMANARLRSAPKIRLLGLWLEEAGFQIGESVEVEVSPGRLVLTPVEKVDGSHTG
jgi:hypothetical protein